MVDPVNNSIDMKLSFIGSSHIAYWILDRYFADQEYTNYGLPGAGISYIERFRLDVSDSIAIIMIGTNDLYEINGTNMEEYATRYVKAIASIKTQATYLVSILPRNDYQDSASLNKFIAKLNSCIRPKAESAGIHYIDIFPLLIKDGRMDDSITFDELHLNAKGYALLSETIRQSIGLK